MAAMTRRSTLRRLQGADRAELALLEQAQELDLQSRRKVADLVEEGGPAVGRLDQPLLVSRQRR